MAKKVKDSTLDSRTAREKLKPSGKSYFKSIDRALHLGYRKGKSGRRWVIRRYIGDGTYLLERSGPPMIFRMPTVLDFYQAQKKARARR